MPTDYVVTNPVFWLHDRDFTSDSSALALNYEAVMKDLTKMGNDTRVQKGTKKVVDFGFNGDCDFVSGAEDEKMFGSFAVADKLASYGMPNYAGAENSPIHFFKFAMANMSINADRDDFYRAEAGGSGAGKLIRGIVLVNEVSAFDEAGGNKTAYQMGAVGATQKLYAGIHVFDKEGTSPTLDVVIASDDNQSFTSGTSRITVAQQTDKNSLWLDPVDGAITDDWWRAQVTLGGSATPGFKYALVLGIG